MLLNLPLALCGCTMSQTECLVRELHYYSTLCNYVEKLHLRGMYLGDYWYADIVVKFKLGSPRYKTITKTAVTTIITNMYLILYSFYTCFSIDDLLFPEQWCLEYRAVMINPFAGSDIWALKWTWMSSRHSASEYLVIWFWLANIFSPIIFLFSVREERATFLCSQVR